MEITQIYAIVAGGVFLLLMFMKGFPFIQQVLQSLNITISRYLTYPLVVRRHRLLGPWSPADVLLQLLYISLNVFCVTFRVTSFDEAGDRAGTLSIINMAPLFFGLHLSFLADLLGLSLSNYRRIHRSAGIMSFALVALHIFAAVHHDPTYSLRVPENLYLLIGIASLSFLMIVSLRFIRKLSYEFFLRTHQALAFLSGYVLWRHLSSKSFVNQVCLYVSAGIFGFTSVVQLFATLYRNSVFRGRLPRAVITNVGGGFKISLTVHGKLKVDAGQYINLWIPSVSFWSFLQSHPFMVASCEEGEQTTLDLLVDPQKGFTFKLQRLARYESGSDRSDFRRALFTGPHGASAPLGEFERVLMVASGFGIVAQLPYLRQLIRGYNDFTTRTRRICLVWQLENIEDGAPAQEFLNQALKEDALDDSYILRISIYYASGHLEHGSLNEGQHRRVSAHKGTMNLVDVLRAEVLREYKSNKSDMMLTTMGKRGEDWDADALVDGVPGPGEAKLASVEKNLSLPEERKKGGEMLVMVSGSQGIRDDLRRLVRGYLDDGLSLLEMDYQPNT